MNNTKKTMAFLVTALMIQSCVPGYVSVRPTYSHHIRPERPSSFHIWVGDGWKYHRKSRAYTERSGHWTAPKHKKSYQEGQ